MLNQNNKSESLTENKMSILINEEMGVKSENDRINYC